MDHTFFVRPVYLRRFAANTPCLSALYSLALALRPLAAVYVLAPKWGCAHTPAAAFIYTTT